MLRHSTFETRSRRSRLFLAAPAFPPVGVPASSVKSCCGLLRFISRFWHSWEHASLLAKEEEKQPRRWFEPSTLPSLYYEANINPQDHDALTQDINYMWDNFTKVKNEGWNYWTLFLQVLSIYVTLISQIRVPDFYWKLDFDWGFM